MSNEDLTTLTESTGKTPHWILGHHIANRSRIAFTVVTKGRLMLGVPGAGFYRRLFRVEIQNEKWRKCMGIEPTNRMISIQLTGFEDRARHQPWIHFLTILNQLKRRL